MLLADVDAPLQDLMTFTTKAEEDKLMASSKQVEHTQWKKHSDSFTEVKVLKLLCENTPLQGRVFYKIKELALVSKAVRET